MFQQILVRTYFRMVPLKRPIQAQRPSLVAYFDHDPEVDRTKRIKK